jgi:hypothetical protein
MSNAGYGNHDPSGPADAKPADNKPDAGTGGKPGTGSSPAEGAATERAASTPGDGASSHGPQGDEVDPGAG